MKVRFVDASPLNGRRPKDLTLGKEYQVTLQTELAYHIIDDEQNVAVWNKRRFVTVEDFQALYAPEFG